MISTIKSIKKALTSLHSSHLSKALAHDVESVNEFHQITQNSKDISRLLLFYNTYGKPSQAVKKKVETKANTYKKQLVTVDVEAVPELCEKYHVESVPTLFAVKNNHIEETYVGVPNDDKIDFLVKNI